MRKFLFLALFLMSQVAFADAPVIWSGTTAEWLPSGLRSAGVCKLDANGVMTSGSISLVSNTSGVLPVLSGGTGESSYTDGQILMGITAGNTLSKGTITAGSGITVTNGPGAITIAAAGTSGVTAVGAFDSQAKDANGAVISGTDIFLQSAAPGFPGALSNGTQTITGAKTFSSTPTFSTMTLGSSLFAGAGGILAQDNAYNFYDVTNHRQGYGTTTPSSLLTVKNVTDSLNEGIAIEGSGAGPNVRWIHYVSPGGDYSVYHPFQGVYGWSVNATGKMSAANGVNSNANSGALTARVNAGRQADNIIVALNLTGQTGDAFAHYLDDFTTKVFRVDAAGDLTARNLSASTLTTGIAHVGATGLISSSPVVSGDIGANEVADVDLRQSAGLSVIGRSANSTGNVADITAGTDDHVLRRSGTAIGFGQVATGGISDLAVTNAKIANNTIDLPSKVTGVLPVLSGGTGQSSYTDGQILIGRSSDNSLSKATLTAGSNITITNGPGAITIASSGGGGGSGTFASVKWVGTGSCNWSRTSNASFASFSADSDCTTPTGGSIVGTGISAPGTKVPGFVIDSADTTSTTYYKVTVTGNLATIGSVSSPCATRLTDGTDVSQVVPIWGTNTGNGNNNATVYYIHLSTSGSRTLELQMTGATTNNQCDVLARTAGFEELTFFIEKVTAGAI